MKERLLDAKIEWRIAEQRFSGRPEEVAVQLDQLLLTLVAMRQRLPGEARRVPPRASPPRTSRAD